jgi:hypothetical protein
MNANTMPGDREAAGAIAGMSDTYGYRPAVGDAVIAEPPYLGGRRAGIVRAVNAAYCLVEMDGDTLAYYPHELEYVGKATPA